MSILVCHWILLISCHCMHIAHASARLLLEDHVDHRRADMAMKKFDPSEKVFILPLWLLCYTYMYIYICASLFPFLHSFIYKSHIYVLAVQADDNIKLKLGADTNYVEIRTRMLLAAGDSYSYKTSPPISTAGKAPKETMKVIDESDSTDTDEHDDVHREGYSSVASTKHLDSFSSSRSQQPQKGGIDKSTPGFSSDYSKPRMRTPSHNRWSLWLQYFFTILSAPRLSSLSILQAPFLLEAVWLSVQVIIHFLYI